MPELFSHGFSREALPGWMGISVWGWASVAEGAMIVGFAAGRVVLGDEDG